MKEGYDQFMVRVCSISHLSCDVYGMFIFFVFFHTLDALDSLNNKKAIQQADKILKKQKDLHCAKVK